MPECDDEVRTCRGTGLAPGQLQLTVTDDTLAPLLEAGQQVIVDRGDHALVGGGIYAVREADAVVLWLFVPGFAGLGCQLAGRPIGTLAGLGGRARWRGPVALDAIPLVGRVIEPAQGHLATLAAQQRRLAELHETIGSQLLCLGGPAPVIARPAGMSLEAVAAALAAEVADSVAAERVALELRLDAIDARLACLDELIAGLPADGLADALVKLETLAALQPPDAPDLEPRLLDTALQALRRLADGARTEPRRPMHGGGCIGGGARL